MIVWVIGSVPFPITTRKRCGRPCTLSGSASPTQSVFHIAKIATFVVNGMIAYTSARAEM